MPRVFPFPSNLNVPLGAAYSEAQLNSLVAQYTKAIPSWEAVGVSVSTIAPDVNSDAVLLGLASPLSPAAAHALAGYTAGEPVRTEVVGAIGDQVPTSKSAVGGVSACTRTQCYPDIEGGVAIIDNAPSSSTSLNECSAGAIVNSPDRSVNSAGYELLTAGHCFNQFDTITQGGVLLETVVSRAFGGNVDPETVSISSTWGWTLQLCAYTTGPCAQSVLYAANPVTGWSDCQSGITTGYHCGQVTATNVTVNIRNGPTLTGMVEDNQCSLPGDSGGPHLEGSSVYLEGVTTASNFLTDSSGNTSCNSTPFTFYSPATTDVSATGTSL